MGHDSGCGRSRTKKLEQLGDVEYHSQRTARVAIPVSKIVVTGNQQFQDQLSDTLSTAQAGNHRRSTYNHSLRTATLVLGGVGCGTVHLTVRYRRGASTAVMVVHLWASTAVPVPSRIRVLIYVFR